MALKRMDNVGIVVDDLAATIDFFRELDDLTAGRRGEAALRLAYQS
jgi:catechol 2,3-dioxygenase-like lactoylglutathione lyase family enzyme